MVCLKCWYFHSIKLPILYPVKARILRYLFRYFRKNSLFISGYVKAEIYNGPIHEGKLIRIYEGENTWKGYGTNQIVNFLQNNSGINPSSIALGTLCSEVMDGAGNFKALNYVTKSGSGECTYIKWSSTWDVSGEISNICQAGIKGTEASYHAVHNFNTPFTKQNGQSLKIEWSSTVCPA